MKRMTAKKKEILGLVTGHGERSSEVLRNGPLAPLFDRFDVQDVALSTASAAAPEVLFLIGPQRALSPAELAALDGYVAKGVPLALFFNRRVVNMGNFYAAAVQTGLEPFVEHYGAKLGRDLVLDAQCQRVTIQSNQGGFALANIINYPLMPLSNDLNKKHPLVKNISVLSFPFCHPVEISTAAAKTARFTSLARSSRYSWVVPDLGRVDPYGLPDRPKEGDAKGPFTLAALLEGTAPSYADPSRAAQNFKIAVIGTSYVADENMPNSEENASFLLSLAEWMAQDPNFLAIPSKGAAFRPLRQMTPGGRQAVKVAGLFFLPVAVVAFGFFRWRRRQKRREDVSRSYQEASRA
jgi:ABC-type uncharacterized transport system involved in gliding motility auxiliary subunit